MDIRYLQPPFQQGGLEHKSPYMAALMDARASTGRNVNTGLIHDASRTGNWSGTLAYLVLIDHIGNHITKTLGGSTDPRAFTKALSDFTALTTKEKFAFYALRCAFAHQYSLINVGRGHDKLFLHHQFVVHRGETLITFPATPWNGIRTPATHGLITQISLKKVGDLVEEIHAKLLIMGAANQLTSTGELIFISYAP